MILTIATPHRNDMKAEYTASLAMMMPTFKNTKIHYIAFETAVISEGRNKMFFAARDNNSDYLLFVDSDIEFPCDAVQKLINTGKDVITGIYYKRQPPFEPLVHEFNEKGLIENLVHIPDYIFQIDACGAGFLLISKKVLQIFSDDVMANVGKPFSHIKLESGIELGEDVSFCKRLQTLGVAVWADPSIRLGHVRHDIVYGDYFEKAKQEYFASQKQTNITIDYQENGIAGWTTETELAWLKNAARNAGIIVELGSHKGRSANAMMESCAGTVFCVDSWKGTVEFATKRDGVITQEVFDGDQIFSECTRNIGKYGRFGVLRMDSVEAANFFQDRSVDMVFIDAGHGYESVKKDIEVWLPKTKKLICGHDYSDNWAGVKRAVDEKFGNKIGLVDSIWFCYL